MTHIGMTKTPRMDSAVRTKDLERTDGEITWLEKWYTPHPLAGVGRKQARYQPVNQVVVHRLYNPLTFLKDSSKGGKLHASRNV